MKSSDEHIDEELRKALQQRFDHFERLPDPSLREKIMSGLGGGPSRVQTGVVATLVLLISLTASVYLVSHLREKRQMADKGSIMTHSAAVEPKEARKHPEVRHAPEPLTAAPSAQGISRGSSVSRAWPKPLPNQTIKRVIKETNEPVARFHKPVMEQLRAADKPHRISRAELIQLLDSVRSNPSFGSIWIEQSTVEPADWAFFQSELKKLGIVNDDGNSNAAPVAKTLEGPSVADQDIGVLDHRPLALPQYAWNADSLVTPGGPKKRYEYLFREHWSFIAGVTPLRTFQILTVRNGNGVFYQNFVLPDKISAATVGYKFSAGVERKGFQLLLNYGQFRQSYRYEIATSEFEVGPDLSGNYDVIRKGIPQEQNSTVRLLGLSVKKHTVRRTHFLRNYYGDVGAEFSRDLTSRKNMFWVNAGFGKELLAGKNTVMTVGPYVEYSLSKLRNADNPFKIQPYQIGLSVGLKYTRK